MKQNNDAAGMRGHRSRTKKGPLRAKRGDTEVEKIEEQYNREFDVRGDMHLETLLKKHHKKSLNDLLQTDIGRKK